MDTLLRDIRFAARLLWKEKALTVTVLVTLAVCIGANTAVFGVIETVLLDPLPVPEADRLVRVYNSYPNAGAEHGSTSAPDYFYRRERVRAFEQVASYQYWGHTVGEEGTPERVESMRVTPSFFPLLGVSPILGRTFTEDEMDPASSHRVVLSWGFWQDRFGGDRSVIGTDLRVDGEPYTIVGVLPRSFRFLGVRDNAFYVPIPFTPEDRTPERLHNNNYEMIARLAPGATPDGAEAEIATLDHALTDLIPIPNAQQLLKDVGYHVVVTDLKDDMLRDIRPTLFLLWAGVAFVLLIGCVNIANLMLARSSGRIRELATRLSLGADRRRLARQLLTESLLIAVAGGALGLAVGALGLRAMGALGVADLPRGTEVGINAGVVVFTFVASLVAGAFFGAIPLIHLFRTDLNAVFRAETRTGTATRRAVLARGGLVMAQVAVAFVLLIGAGLMLASFRAALHVDPGFKPGSVLTGYLALPQSRYPDASSRTGFFDEMLGAVRSLPGVERASVTSQVPFGGSNSSSVVLPEGYVPEAGESLLSPFRTVVGTEYFATLGIPVLEGREFLPSDDADAVQVMVIDRWLARRYWPDSSPIGRRMLMGVPGDDNTEDQFFTVVGVVGDIKHHDLTEADHFGAFYLPYTQMTASYVTLVARTTPAPTSLVAPVREAVTGIDPDLPFYLPQSMQSRIDETLQVRRAPMIMLGVFSAVALFLAAIGIYGVLAYSVSQRTRELGVRMALGGRPAQIFGMVVRQGGMVVGVGLAAGLAASLLLARLIRSLLYGVQPTDPMVLGIVFVTLGAVGAIACILPARRATQLDPVEALSSE